MSLVSAATTLFGHVVSAVAKNSSAVTPDEIVAAAKVIATTRWSDMVAAWHSQDLATKILQGEVALDVAAKVVAVFIPPVAIFANDLEVAIDVEKLAIPFVEWLAAQPAPVVQPGEISAWGHTFTGTITQGAFA
ncbi:hypothetical protein [Beijerinckia sp. L45]|uniref:hypothetical protein n=1 Tax=Beijerinckia sp. L45 TaxID=1641855 RepID=UPI00131C9B59|nr:hypothetical protein [Beijerinckia sp. L45]